MAAPQVVYQPGQQQTQVVYQSQAPFEENAAKYKCCCSCCHVRTGTLIFVIFSAIGLVSSMYGGFGQGGSPWAQRYDGSYDWISLIMFLSQCVLLFWQIFSVVGAFIAICKEKPMLLLPYLIMVGFCMVLFLLLAIGCIVVALLFSESDWVKNWKNDQSGTSKGVDTGVQTLCWLLVATFIVVFLFHVWVFKVVLACYRYLKDRQAWKLMGASGGAQPMAQVQQPLVQNQPAQYPQKEGALPAYPQQQQFVQQPTNPGYQPMYPKV